MSMHKIELTELERTGLILHGLQIALPSQLSDSFRLGMTWALTNSTVVRGWVKFDEEDKSTWPIDVESYMVNDGIIYDFEDGDNPEIIRRFFVQNQFTHWYEIPSPRKAIEVNANN